MLQKITCFCYQKIVLTLTSIFLIISINISNNNELTLFNKIHIHYI